MPTKPKPITTEDLFKALEYIAASVATIIDQIQSQGVVAESTDGQIEAAQKRVEANSQKIAKEKERIRKLRDYMRHKKSLMKKT